MLVVSKQRLNCLAGLTNHWLSRLRKFHSDVLQVFQDWLIMLLQETKQDSRMVKLSWHGFNFMLSALILGGNHCVEWRKQGGENPQRMQTMYSPTDHLRIQMKFQENYTLNDNIIRLHVNSAFTNTNLHIL